MITATSGASRAPQQGLSHVQGLDRPPLIQATVDALLQAAVQRDPDGTAAIFRESGQRLTWRQLSEQSDRFAAGLLSVGVSPGDRVGIWSPNRREWVVTQFAAARVGAVLVNINPAYRP